jgi:ABC-type proline/glycine betaine transport system substrate-binding protein
MEPNRLDEIATQLDDIALALEEMEEHCPVSAETLDSMRKSIEKATESIDRMQNPHARPADAADVRRQGSLPRGR